MFIREFRVEDAAALAALFHASVHHVGRGHYSPEQLSAWSPSVPDPHGFVGRASDGRVFLVAVDASGAPLAYGDVEADGHIDHLYCRPDAVGLGIASALYDQLEEAARERNVPLLSVDASEAARPLFQRKGFTLENRRDFTLGGVAIHNFRMTKRL